MSLKSSALSKILGIEPVNPRDFIVTQGCAPDNVRANSVTMVTRTEENLCALFQNAPADVVVIAPTGKEAEAHDLPQMFFFMAKPRLGFCKVANCLIPARIPSGVASSAIIGPEVILGEGVSIGPWTLIEGIVEIGEGSQIGERVTIQGPATIGRGVSIGPGSVIGQPGFGFETMEDDTSVRFPHFGRVILGDGVEVGANASISRGSLNDTVIGNQVKIDDRVHVGHNVTVDAGTRIASGAVLCGSCRIGKNVWVSPNAVVSNLVNIGDRALVGLGAVVVTDVPAETSVAARPALPVGKRTS